MMKNDPATDESPLLKAPRDAEAPPPKRHGFDAGDASYALASFGAVVRPVSATMLVASFFVVSDREGVSQLCELQATLAAHTAAALTHRKWTRRTRAAASRAPR